MAGVEPLGCVSAEGPGEHEYSDCGVMWPEYGPSSATLAVCDLGQNTVPLCKVGKSEFLSPGVQVVIK